MAPRHEERSDCRVRTVRTWARCRFDPALAYHRQAPSRSSKTLLTPPAPPPIAAALARRLSPTAAASPRPGACPSSGSRAKPARGLRGLRGRRPARRRVDARRQRRVVAAGCAAHALTPPRAALAAGGRCGSASARGLDCVDPAVDGGYGRRAALARRRAVRGGPMSEPRPAPCSSPLEAAAARRGAPELRDVDTSPRSLSRCPARASLRPHAGHVIAARLAAAPVIGLAAWATRSGALLATDWASAESSEEGHDGARSAGLVRRRGCPVCRAVLGVADHALRALEAALW